MLLLYVSGIILVVGMLAYRDSDVAKTSGAYSLYSVSAVLSHVLPVSPGEKRRDSEAYHRMLLISSLRSTRV